MQKQTFCYVFKAIPTPKSLIWVQNEVFNSFISAFLHSGEAVSIGGLRVLDLLVVFPFLFKKLHVLDVAQVDPTLTTVHKDANQTMGLLALPTIACNTNMSILFQVCHRFRNKVLFLKLPIDNVCSIIELELFFNDQC